MRLDFGDWALDFWRSHMKKRLLANVFIVYLGFVAALTIVPTHLAGFRWPDSLHINLVPFRYSVRCFLQAYGTYASLKAFCFRNTLGNIVLFLPLGLLLPAVSPRLRSFRQVLLVALCFSMSIELIQFALRFVGNPRAVDIDDVILNTFGAGLGFLIYRLGRWKQRTVVSSQ